MLNNYNNNPNNPNNNNNNNNNSNNNSSSSNNNNNNNNNNALRNKGLTMKPTPFLSWFDNDFLLTVIKTVYVTFAFRSTPCCNICLKFNVRVFCFYVLS